MITNYINPNRSRSRGNILLRFEYSVNPVSLSSLKLMLDSQDESLEYISLVDGENLYLSLSYLGRINGNYFKVFENVFRLIKK